MEKNRKNRQIFSVFFCFYFVIDTLFFLHYNYSKKYVQKEFAIETEKKIDNNIADNGTDVNQFICSIGSRY